jgi:hypothetical protein
VLDRTPLDRLVRRPRRTALWAIRGAALTLLGLSLAGCATGGGWPALLALALSAGTLALSGCSMSHEGGEDAAVADAGVDDASVSVSDGGGYWEACCVEGVIDTCFCPAGAACNYGWFTDCGGGTCTYEPSCGDAGTDAAVDAGADAGFDAGSEEPDAGGYWEACCVDGMIDTCFCPGGAICNYGWYTDCGDGTCVAGPGDACPDAADAGAAP